MSEKSRKLFTGTQKAKVAIKALREMQEWRVSTLPAANERFVLN